MLLYLLLNSERLNKKPPDAEGKRGATQDRAGIVSVGNQSSRVLLGTGAAIFTKPQALENLQTQLCLAICPLMTVASRITQTSFWLCRFHTTP